MGAVIYARISLDDRSDNLGVARQEKVCRELATKLGLTVDAVLVDNDVSAYAKRPRPQFERLVRMMEDGTVGAVITYHSDRLYRRLKDLERLVDIIEKSGVQIHTVSSGTVDLTTASGQMVARMMGAAAQHESARTGERMKAKNDERARNGTPHGGKVPFGFTEGYEHDPVQADAVRFMVRRILEGAPLRGIARELTEQGVSTWGGGIWHHTTVRQIILSPTIAGLRVHRKEVVGRATWEPIVSREDWERVGLVLSDPARKRRRPARDYLLTGFLVSSGGDPMRGHTDTKGRRMYTTRVGASVGAYINADDMEAWFTPIMVARLRGLRLPNSKTPLVVDPTEQELAELTKARADNLISMAEWLTVKAGIEARRPQESAPPVLPAVLRRPAVAAKQFPDAPLRVKREMLSAVLAQLVVGPATRGRWTPLEDRLHPPYGEVWKL